ncbi:hypothetical protein F2Q69_00005560 [Brassica cretica]|uniref:Uncharacterized protein n=1 Tax=Brassica cretica TaxID=69181 RepID=A0A8S9P9E9_BRACR|nr:hypothetical protein F2Q69_00005560 [Brassica cretica]
MWRRRIAQPFWLRPSLIISVRNAPSDHLRRDVSLDPLLSTPSLRTITREASIDRDTRIKLLEPELSIPDFKLPDQPESVA